MILIKNCFQLNFSLMRSQRSFVRCQWTSFAVSPMPCTMSTMHGSVVFIPKLEWISSSLPSFLPLITMILHVQTLKMYHSSSMNRKFFTKFYKNIWFPNLDQNFLKNDSQKNLYLKDWMNESWIVLMWSKTCTKVPFLHHPWWLVLTFGYKASVLNGDWYNFWTYSTEWLLDRFKC